MEERFWSKVNKTDTCWLWTGAIHKKGYGRFMANGKGFQVHRLSWILAGNTIPEGLLVCHAPHETCGNRHCVNPAHLRTDTPKANMFDKIADGTINRGTKQGSNKLTVEQVRAIRANSENKSQRELAKEYGVCRENIRDIISRKRWSWLV